MKLLRACLIAFCACLAMSICEAQATQRSILAASGLSAQIQWPWDQPPPEFKDMERRGFHDGVQSAIKDFNHHREPEPERHKEFQNPHVHRSFVEDYRKGFRRGYDDAMQHMVSSKEHHY